MSTHMYVDCLSPEKAASDKAVYASLKKADRLNITEANIPR